MKCLQDCELLFVWKERSFSDVKNDSFLWQIDPESSECVMLGANRWPVTHTHARTHTYARTHAHIHTHAHTHAHTRTHTRTHARTHALTYTHARTHTHSRTHACAHKHTHTHTHTHTHHGYILVIYPCTDPSIHPSINSRKWRQEKFADCAKY